MVKLPRRPVPVLLVFLSVALVVFVLYRSHQPVPPPVQALSGPYSLPLLFRDRIGAFIPRGPKWAWAYRTLDAIFGRRAIISISTQLLELHGLTSRGGSPYGLGQPDFSDGTRLQVWLLRAPQISSLRQGLKAAEAETVSQPRITTGEGAEASVFAGEPVVLDATTNQVGFESAYFARVHPDRTDLFARVLFTAAITNDLTRLASNGSQVGIQTNVAIALRIQIPKGAGVFMMNTPSTDQDRKSFGVIIDPP